MGSGDMFLNEYARNQKGSRYDADMKKFKQALTDIGASLGVIELELSRNDESVSKAAMVTEVERIRKIIEQHAK